MIPLCSIYIRKRCGRTIPAAIARLVCGGLEAHADLSRRHLKGVFAAAEVGQGNRLAVCVRVSVPSPAAVSVTVSPAAALVLSALTIFASADGITMS